MTDIFGALEGNAGKFKTTSPVPGVYITFSNTSNPAKWFTITVDQLSNALSDIRAHREEFANTGRSEYEETLWRDLFERFLTDKPVRALAGVQTLPLFTLLSKIIHYSGSNGAYQEKKIDLSDSSLKNAIERLDEYALSKLSDFTATLTGVTSINSVTGGTAIPGGKNEIYYGAPGTGKSYKVDQIVGAAGTGTVVRTVFHPDTQNSDFTGCLKPVTSGDNVTYAFSPGPFARALVNAARDPQKMHYLVIEELNRAPAAAVFGELFLLLDRDGTGKGQYDVDFPSEEFRKWWGHETEDNVATKLHLPSNLSIIATMNSADQGVFPLDTAFRRRWEQHYMKIDPQQAHEANISYVGSSDTTVTVSWKIFVGKLNDFLVNDLGGNISEDRLVGHYFLSKADLPDAGANEIPGKLLIYLWDDLLRHHGRDILFDKSIKSYGELSSRIRDKRIVFSRKFLDSLPADTAGSSA